MAFHDRATRTLVLRVVYDGMGTAGKTTNIDRIWEQFSVARDGDVYSPEVVRGRTLYFDWLELHAGRVEGYKVRCQVVTVPGQFAYVQRRWELLRFPDAIVAVCDSSSAALARTKVGIHFLRRTMRAREMEDVPLVVQANKQDLPDAIPAEELGQLLGLTPPIEIVGASASDGSGVRRTLMKAIHAAVERTRKRLQLHGIDAFEPLVERPEELYDRMKRFEDSGELEEGARVADDIIAELDASV
jgi:signal recognition particle receptor subunit beta